MKTLQLTKLPKTENGAVAVGNAIDKFRDGFTEGFNPAIWDESWSNQGSSFRSVEGNSSGATYLNISMCPYTVDSEYILTTKQFFKMPVRFGYGLSISQRILADEIQIALVGCDANGNIETNSTIPSLNILGTVSITSNVATINFATNHGLKGNDRIILVGNAESRLNVGPVYVTVVTPTQITVPCTLANGTYTAGGQVVWADTFGYVKNALGLVYENTTATNAQWATRRNGGKSVNINSTVSTTVAVIGNTSPYTEAFRSAGDMDVISTMEYAKYFARAQSSMSGTTGNAKWTESIPDDEKYYKIQIRVKNLSNISRPVADISSISKTGTTTATVVTATPHGLVNGSQVQIYGVRDQTNFPNLTAQTAITYVDPTTFTIVIGTASTTSSAGGFVYLNQGSQLGQDLYNLSIQSISRSGNILTAIMSSTVAGTPGEWVNLHGMDGSGTVYDGPYKILKTSTTTWELESVGPDFGSITCGGGVTKRTDVRIHYVRLLDYTRHIVEIQNARGANDASESIPVTLAVTPSVAAVQSTVGTLGAGWYMKPDTLLVNDVASAAITTTTTTAAITPTPVGGAGEFNIIVTAVSGTTPTMDVGIEESDDTGTNWYRIYDFPRIIATGAYRTPPLMLTGNRFRYVQTIGGTSPSFTRTVNRIIHQFVSFNPIRQIIDRAINVNSVNATTTSLKTNGARNLQIVVNMGAITTTAPQFQLQGSDDNGATWYSIGTAITSVASSSVSLTINNLNSELVRAIETVGGVGATIGANGILIKAFG